MTVAIDETRRRATLITAISNLALLFFALSSKYYSDDGENRNINKILSFDKLLIQHVSQILFKSHTN